MNVRITPRSAPTRTDLYGGVDSVQSDGTWLLIWCSHEPVVLAMQNVAEIALDDEPGDWF